MSTTTDEPVGHLAAEHPSETGLSERVRSLIRANPWPICAVTLVAALLRFTAIEDVSPNQFYDAAARLYLLPPDRAG